MIGLGFVRRCNGEVGAGAVTLPSAAAAAAFGDFAAEASSLESCSFADASAPPCFCFFSLSPSMSAETLARILKALPSFFFAPSFPSADASVSCFFAAAPPPEAAAGAGGRKSRYGSLLGPPKSLTAGATPPRPYPGGRGRCGDLMAELGGGGAPYPIGGGPPRR